MNQKRFDSFTLLHERNPKCETIWRINRNRKERPNKKDYTFGKNVVYYNYWDKKTENANTR